MATWKYKYFAMKEEPYMMGKYVQNCGLCINWTGDKCIHENWIKELGENYSDKATTTNSDSISNIDNEYDRSSNGC
jgi:hypothetical protein